MSVLADQIAALRGKLPSPGWKRKLWIGLAALLCLFILWTATGPLWRHWRRPPKPEIPVEVVTQPAKDKIDAALLKRLQGQRAQQDKEIGRLQDELAKALAQAEAKVESQVSQAAREGTDALARLGTEWWRPGTLERLKGPK